MTDAGLPAMVTTAFAALAVGLLAGIAWERSQQPWQRVDGVLGVSGAQVLELQEGESRVRLAAESTQASLTVSKQGASVEMVATDEQVGLELRQGDGELTVHVGEEGVRVYASVEGKWLEMSLAPDAEQPSFAWSVADATPQRCLLGPDAVQCGVATEQ